jgi:intergrase/recombinase
VVRTYNPLDFSFSRDSRLDFYLFHPRRRVIAIHMFLDRIRESATMMVAR